MTRQEWVNKKKNGKMHKKWNIFCSNFVTHTSFLRSERSLIQTTGRAARNADGYVIMYADKITASMQVAIDETKRRRNQTWIVKKHQYFLKSFRLFPEK